MPPQDIPVPVSSGATDHPDVPQSRVSVQQVLTDPQFQAMTPEQKRQVLIRIDPEFAQLSPTQQMRIASYEQPAAAETKEAPKPDRSALNYAYQALAGPARAAKGMLWDMPGYALETFGRPDKYPAGIAGRMISDITEGLRSGQAAREQARKSGEGIPGQILSTMEQYPLGIGALTRKAEEGGTRMFSPESIGATTEAASYLLAPKLAEKAVSGVRIGQQEFAGAGKEPVLRTRMAQQERAAEVAERNRAELEKTRAANEAAAEKAKEKYQEELGKWKEGKEKSAAKTAEAKREWMRRTQEVERSKLEKAGRPAEKRGAERRVRDFAEQFQENAKRAHSQVRKALDERWKTFRKLTAKATLPRTELYKTVADARERLQGAPGDLKVFNDFMKEIGLEVSDTGELTAKAGKEADMPLDTARVHSTAIGEKLAAGGLPGNVYQALKLAKEGLEKQIEGVAQEHGAGDFYRSLKRDWSTYMGDWRDVQSPLANVVKAPNSAAVEKLMLSDASRENLSQLASKYQGMGKTASGVGGLTPTTISAAGRLAQNIGDLPALRGAAGSRQGMVLESESPALAFERANIPATPKPGAEAFGQFVRPEQKIPQLQRMPPEVVPADIRRNILLNMAGRPFRWWERPPSPFFMERLLLKSPAYRDWIASQARRESAVPPLRLPPPIGRQPLGPEPGPEQAVRQGQPTAGLPPGGAAEQNQIWQGVVDNLRERIKRQQASGDMKGAADSRVKLDEAEAKLKTTFGSSSYATTPQSFGKTGGGANYTPSDLDALKKRYGIQ